MNIPYVIYLAREKGNIEYFKSLPIVLYFFYKVEYKKKQEQNNLIAKIFPFFSGVSIIKEINRRFKNYFPIASN